MKIKTISLAALILIAAALFAFRQKTLTTDNESKRGMIKVTILYPNAEGKTFDMNYYATKHMPLVASLLGDSLRFFEIDKGISGRTPADPIPYLAIGYLYFDRLSAYQNSFRANAEKIRNDIPNYTNIQPVIQISEVIR